MKEIFVVEKISIYNTENNPLMAYRYEPVYFVESLEQAEDIVKKAGKVDRRECWAFDDDMPVYRYYKLRIRKIKWKKKK